MTDLNVSRETHDKLELFEALLRKWNPKINLVAPSTIDAFWTRHALDSFETARCISQPSGTWVDIGSGGGFPGILIALHLQEVNAVCDLTFIESDKRKCVFLSTVSRELGLKVKVISSRIEATEAQNADIVSARALAPLPKLLEYCLLHLRDGGRCILPKGTRWKEEVEDARQSFVFDLEVHPSLTQEGSVNLEIQGLSRV